jgi:membrane peptidoglycan carboxypeptidase
MKRWKVYIPALTIEVALLLACLAAYELKSSHFQAAFFSKIGKQIHYEVKPGRSGNIRFPSTGPYDIRLGYTKLPLLRKSLVHHGFRIVSQARISPRLRQLMDFGLYPSYNEKPFAGLRILDRYDHPIYQVTRPERVFPDFDSIPKVIVQSLLFIENREILDLKHPEKNPAVEWDRLGKAVLEKAVQELYPDRSGPGGSTLATQLEKYRHSFEGRTRTAKDKLTQMLSASFRAYLDGPNTVNRRKKIVLDYINSIPLAALPGFGEVNGLGDGLWAWYGADVTETTEILNHMDQYLSPDKIKTLARAYKQVLSLFIAHRRPSSFLLTDVQILNALTDDYLQILATNKIIPPALRDAAQEIDLHLRSSAPPPPKISYLDRKAANAIRTKLLTDLSLPKLYELDQVDLTVHTAIARDIQDRITDALSSLKDRKTAEKFGLMGDRNLQKGDPAKVIYSVTLYERVGSKNLLRVETDNYDKPFNLNEGAKLDLGSTAKLRVLTNYLEIVDSLFSKFSGKDPKKLKASGSVQADPLSQWVLDYVQANPKADLKQILDAAMNRTYSASTAEAFFTGGGVHHFHNFKNEDNGRIVTISEAVRNSINLPFIRLMRDIVRYYMAQIPGSPMRANTDENEEARQEYLSRFADKEGTYFLEQFYQKYRTLEPDELLPFLLRNVRPTPIRLTAIFRFLFPEKTKADLSAFLDTWLPLSNISKDTVESLYEKYGPGKFSLQDQGYIARVHPLELWLVGYLHKHPKANFAEITAASTKERQEVYEWLFKTKNRHAQDKRIRVLVETEAFLEIHRAWKRLGYPFDSLVPSYATAIGSSGDRPAALAELVGIIMNDGVRYPVVRITGMEFAKGTPFETNFRSADNEAERILKPEVAARLREALMDVAANGTARRASKTFKDLDGNYLPIGGKTGTGDHRYDTFGKGGQLLSSRVVNRTATFVFFIGSKFFGVVTAHVHGEQAAHYDFTSSLAAGLLKALEPALRPLIESGLAAQKEAQEEEELRKKYAELDAYSEHPLCVDFGILPPLTEQCIAEFSLWNELTRLKEKPVAKKERDISPAEDKTAKKEVSPTPKLPAPRPAATEKKADEKTRQKETHEKSKKETAKSPDTSVPQPEKKAAKQKISPPKGASGAAAKSTPPQTKKPSGEKKSPSSAAKPVKNSKLKTGAASGV